MMDFFGWSRSHKRRHSRRSAETARKRSSTLMEAAAYGLLAFSVLAFGTVEAWAVAVFEVWAFSLALFLWLGFALKGDKLALPGPALALPVFMVAGIGALQLLNPEPLPRVHGPLPFTAAVWETRSQLLRWGSYFALLLVFAALSRERGFLRRFARFFFSLGVFVAVAGLVQDASGNTAIYMLRSLPPGNYDPFGPFFNRDHAAGFLAMALNMGAGLFLAQFDPSTNKKKIGPLSDFLAKQTLILIGLAAVAWGLVRTGSKGGCLAAAVGAVPVAFLSCSFLFRGRRRATARLIILLILAASAGALFEFFSQADRLETLLTSRSVRFRLSIWAGTIELLRDFPLWGTGLGTFKSVFSYYQDLAIPTITEHAHCDYLQFAAEIGLAGACVVVAFPAWAYLRTLGRWFAAESWEMRCLGAGGLAAALGFAAHNAVDFNFQIIANASAFLALFSWLTAMFHHRVPPPAAKDPPVPKRPLALLGAAVWLTACVLALRPAVAAYYTAMEHEFFRAKAARIDPADPLHSRNLAQRYLRLARENPAVAPVLAREALRLLVEVNDRFSLDFWTPSYLAEVLELLGREGDAGDFLHLAALRRPRNWNAQRRWALWNLEAARTRPDGAASRIETAKAVFKRFLAFDTRKTGIAVADFERLAPDRSDVRGVLPDTPAANLDYAIFLEKRGEFEKSAAYMEKYLTRNPGYAEMHFWLADRAAVRRTRPWSFSEEHFKKAVELAPREGRYRFWFAKHLTWRKQPAAAEVQFKILLDLDPSQHEVTPEWIEKLETRYAK